MGPRGYHSVDALGYFTLDGIWQTGLESFPLPHNCPVAQGRRRPVVPALAVL